MRPTTSNNMASGPFSWTSGDIPVRYFHFLAHILFLAAIIMAGCFYLERNTGDPGWRLFYMINEANICPSHGRWILVFVQILPVLAIKFGLNLKAILILHSIGPVLFFYILYLYTGFRLKNLWVSMALVIMLVLSVSEIYFYWADLEKHLMTGLLITLYATLFKEGKRLPESWLLIPLFIYLILSSHPTAIIAFVFLIVWHTVCKKRPDVYIYILSALFIFLNTLHADAYENSMAVKLGEILSFSDLKELYIGERIWTLFTHNLVVWSFALATLIIFTVRKKFLFLIMLLGLICGYLFMLMTLVPTEQTEPYFIPLVALILLLFLSETHKLFFPKPTGLILTGLLFIMGTTSILLNKSWATDKVNLQKYMIETASDMDGSRFLFHDKDIPNLSNHLLTGYFYAETMMISALDGKENACAAITASIIVNHIDAVREFFPDSVMNHYFPPIPQSEFIERLPSFADTYFQEEYLEGQFKLYFHQNLNTRYFRNTTDQFQWVNVN